MSVDQSGSARTFFNITELVTITFDFLETSQCVPLLRISHSCFSVAALRVWADISDAQILLALLVGIHVEDSPFAEHDSGKVFSIRGDVNFQRFNVYAPFVKYLNVYGNEHRHFIIKDWRPLFLRAQQTPLLPNLMTLTLYAIDSRFACDQLLWISAFASPSLIRFTPIHIVDSNKCLISYVATSIILKTITERCPNLQSLALYPQKRAGDMYSDGESCLLNLILVTPFVQYLRSLTNIRQLSASLSLIDADGLLAIGNLPQLEQLSIRGCDDYLEKKNFSIPDASFLQLKNLTLEDLYIDQIADLMTIKPLARNLLSVSFCHRFGAEDEETRISWFTDGLPRLLQYTSCLTHLSYDATYGSRLDWNHFVSRGLIQRTSELDLKVIQLFGLHFDTLETIASIPPAWSTLTELRLTHGYIGVGRLPYFARLPKLRWLALPISLANDGVPWPKFYVDHAYNLALHTFETTEARAPLNAFADPMLVARSLLSLWPNLRSVVCPNLDKISPSQSTDLVNGFIEALNVSILAHSEAIAQLSWSGMSGGEAQ